MIPKESSRLFLLKNNGGIIDKVIMLVVIEPI